jgi:cation:H+ antiporter
MFSTFYYLGVIFLASLVIMKACNVFEPAANYLGRNMKAGAKGAIIDAIGSSLPELLVTLMFVFSGKPELILAGIGVTASSAIFNSCLIPALSIFFAKDKAGNKVDHFELNRITIITSGVWLLTVEVMLIVMLGQESFTIPMCLMLLAGYAGYVATVIYRSNKAGDGVDDYEYESLESTSKLNAWSNLDINNILFKDKPFTNTTAVVTLLFSVLVIGLACHWLAVGVEGFALAIGIPVVISAVVLGAAATSVPDTLLSIKSAQNGEGEDAIENPIGSNVFDVTVSLAVPILLYLLVSGGVLPIEQSELLTQLRYVVLGTSFAVISSLFITAKRVTHKTAWFLLALYAGWLGFICYTLV